MSASSKHDGKRVVPWFSRREFERVYSGLYSRDTYCQRQAVGKVTMWRCRGMTKLPVAIDCTADLVSARVDHKLTNKAGSIGMDEYKIRSVYALTLIRFVNHITEKGQNKQFAQPVHVLAEEFGLPDWLVDLRHESTHGVLPSLSMLSEGVTWALHWLKREYWEKQTAQEEAVSVDTEQQSNEGLIRDILVTFQQIHFMGEGHRSSNSPELRHVLADMESLFAGDRRSAISCVCEDGYLLTTPDQLEALGVNIEDLLNGEDCLDLPEVLVTFWKPVLKLLHHLNSTPVLVQFLCNQITENHFLRNRLTAGWIHEIIQANENAGNETVEPSNKSLYKTSCRIAWHTLFDICIHTPSRYTTLLVKSFIPKLNTDLTSKDGEQVTTLMGLYTNLLDRANTAAVSNKDLKQTFTVSDIIGQTKQQGNKSRQTNIEMLTSPWQLCTDVVDWGQYPFGLLPNQQMSSVNFDLSVLLGGPGEDRECMQIDNIDQIMYNLPTSDNSDLNNNDDDDDDGSINSALNFEVLKSNIHLL